MDVDKFNPTDAVTNKPKAFFDIANITEDNQELKLNESRSMVFNHSLFKIK